MTVSTASSICASANKILEPAQSRHRLRPDSARLTLRKVRGKRVCYITRRENLSRQTTTGKRQRRNRSGSVSEKSICFAVAAVYDRRQSSSLRDRRRSQTAATVAIEVGFESKSPFF